ncbi:MAG: hypothetical protein QM628_16010 [Propionicimonas sp.]|jgi:hypothetical protein
MTLNNKLGQARPLSGPGALILSVAGAVKAMPRPELKDQGCPEKHADATHDPRLR